ncbi:ferritin-like domain-containing protein [Rhodobaculum claviforme]|nr:DUF892 family protein [Rhodobaculum claviforme]
MPDDTQTAPRADGAPTGAFQIAAHGALVVSLRNAHALEKQVTAVLEAQLKLLEDYPDLHARVTEHIVATREQARRLEGALEACGSSASLVKDALLSVMGLGQSSVQGFSEDAVLKAVVADMMTEHLEIATYRTLIALADMAGKSELRPRLEESLREEEAMADWFDANLDAILSRFVELKASELQAEAASQDDTSAPDGAPTRTLWQTLEDARSTSTMPGAGTGPETADQTDREPSSSEAPAHADGRRDG